MNEFRSDNYLEQLLLLNEERIKEILSYYYLPQKNSAIALLKTGKRLIYSPNQIKKL